MTPPDPTHAAAARKAAREARPLTQKLMARAARILDKSDGKLTRAAFAKAIGKSYSETVEYLAGFRSAPNSEVTLRIVRFVEKHEAKNGR